MKAGKWIGGAVAALMLWGCGDRVDEAGKGAAPLDVPVSLLPTPGLLQFADDGFFVLPPKAGIAVAAGDEGAAKAAAFVATYAEKLAGITLTAGTEGAVRFLRRDGMGAEAYRLNVSGDGVTIEASTDAGLLYGGVSFLELLGQEPAPAGVQLKALTIEDSPRFGWRGLMLDEARHFRGKDFVKKLLDQMALLKLNTFHWHLVDDQGWRIEIKGYPKLTEVGAWRVPAGRAAAEDIDPATGKPRLYGGFYTQDEIREVVAYAAERAITIVPEIEVPGHATTPIAAYPELAVSDIPGVTAPTHAGSEWGVYTTLFNPYEPTFTFLEGVLTEIVDLFPGRYVHIGGDEAVKDQWKASPGVQAFIKEKGLTDEEALQGYFVERLDKWLSSHGRILIGWDEILEGGLSENATVMSWRGTEGGLEAASHGHDVVMSPSPTLYFDFLATERADEQPGRPIAQSLKTVYEFEPVPAELAADKRHHILGAQANVWSEHMRTDDRVETAIFPRIAALAEMAWTEEGKRDFSAFLPRLVDQLGRWQAMGIRVSDTGFAPAFAADRSGDRVSVTVTNQLGYGDIRYTLDGSAPTLASPKVTAPLDLPLEGKLRAATFAGSVPIAAPRDFGLDIASLRTRMGGDLKHCDNALRLRLEDDGPLGGVRVPLNIDIMKPCWLYEDADMEGVTRIRVSVSELPFNFELASGIAAVEVMPEETPGGELIVTAPGCGGDRIATLPLAPIIGEAGVAAIEADIAPQGEMETLCFRFTRPGFDPLWAIHKVELIAN